jgi:hypothetical protein
MTTIEQAALHMALSPTAGARLAGMRSPRAAVGALLDAGHAEDALKLHARLVAPLYLVAWLCECARRQTLDATDDRGRELAEAWLASPDDTHRDAALAFAMDQRCAHLGAWFAATAAWAATDDTRTQAAHAAIATVTLLSARAPEGFATARDAFVRNALGLLDPFESSP